MTDDRKFWDAVWYLAEFPIFPHTTDAEAQLIAAARSLITIPALSTDRMYEDQCADICGR